MATNETLAREGYPTGKTVQLTLVGLDGNAFNLLGKFQRAARRQGWTQEEIGMVFDRAKAGDYSNLLATLMDHCEDERSDDEE